MKANDSPQSNFNIYSLLTSHTHDSEVFRHFVAFPTSDIPQFHFDSAFQMLAAISLHLDEISRSPGSDGTPGMVEGGLVVGRMKHLRGKRKRLRQFLEESVRRERREEEEEGEGEEGDVSWSRKVKKIGLDALFS